jgi:hypothetical protein
MFFLRRTSFVVEPCVEFFYSYIKRRCEMAKLTNEEKFEIIQKAQEAGKRGDKEEEMRILRQLPLAPHLAKTLKSQIGPDELQKAGFDLSAAEEAYGKNWLSK